jgi:multidrug resistance efflux pump
VIDLTNLKAAGWQKVVAELAADCPDDRAYLERLLRVMARVSASRQAALFVPGGPPADTATGALQVRTVAVYPAPGAGAGDDRVLPGESDQAVLEFASDTRAAAVAALESGQSRAFGLEAGAELYDSAPSQGYLLSLPLLSDGQPAAAITLLIEPRSKQAVQSTLAMAEVLAGYVSGHSARQQLRRVAGASQALDLATRLIAGVNAAPDFRGGAMQVVNDLCKASGADRAAIGWVGEDRIRVVALSDAEHFNPRTAMVVRLKAAMEECLDQDQPVLHPPPNPDEDVTLASAVAHAHRELASGTPNLRVCSVPLREGDRVVGVVTIETASGEGIAVSAVETLQAAFDLVAPVLALKRRDSRWLHEKLWDSCLNGARWFVGPKHTAWKAAGLLLFFGLLLVTFVHKTYRVGAEAFIQPETRQIVSAPFDGLLARVPEGIEAGAQVRAGDVLFEMDTTELLLSAQDARQKIAQAQTQMAVAMGEGKTADAQRAAAQIARSRADLEYAEGRIAKARVVAPIAGTITQGRLRDRIGSTVKLGDRLFEVAPLEAMNAVVRVDERDIALIAPGTVGWLATRANPAESHRFVVEQVVPLAEAKEGQNLFEVRGRLEAPADWMRPGMEGIAKLEVGSRSLIWIGTRRVVEALRLWLW